MDKQIAFAAFEQYWAARSLQTYMEEVYLKKPENTSWLPDMFSRRVSLFHSRSRPQGQV